MTVLGAIRPDEWNWALLLHVGGAMILVGAVLTATSALVLARGDARLLRLGYFSLLAVGLPGWAMTFAGATWIADKEGFTGGNDPTWVGIGWGVGTFGGLLLLISLIVGGIGTYRLRGGKGTVLLKVTMGISLVLLAGFTVTIWAMAGKPS